MTKKVKTKKLGSQKSDWQLLHSEWSRESPRGIVLTATAFIDDRLQELIQAYLIDNQGSAKLFADFNAPLGTLSSKIATAFALGLINEKEYKIIDALRGIRNVFAHRVEVRFADADIVKLATDLVSTFLGGAWQQSKPGKAEEELLLHTRAIAFSLIMTLVERATFVTTKRLLPVDWTELDGIDTTG